MGGAAAATSGNEADYQMAIFVKGKPNLHHIHGAKIQDEITQSEKDQIADWWVKYKSMKDDEYLASLGMCAEEPSTAADDARTVARSTTAKPRLHPSTFNSTSQLDDYHRQSSELWARYTSGELRSATPYHGKRKMPVYYGATLHSVSRTGEDPSFRAH